MDEKTRPYWASEKEPQKLVSRCMERFSAHMRLLKRSGRWDGMRSTLSAYYGNGVDGQRDSSELRETGDAGETVEMHINQVRPLITNTISLIFGQPPAVKAVPTNTDSKSLADTRLAQQLHEYYDRRQSTQERLVDTIRGGLLASSWNLCQSWQPQDGEQWGFDPESGQVLYEGDIATRVLPPWRCVYDFAASSSEQRKWCLVRYPLPRYDLAAQFYERADAAEGRGDMAGAAEAAKARDVATKLCNVAAEPLWRKAADVGDTRNLEALLGEELPEEDVVWVWELRHLPTPALPKGRLVRYMEPDVILWDSQELDVAYPYDKDELHCYEYAPERAVAGSAGHTGAFDLLAMQEYMDIVHASIATWVNVFGQMRFWGGGGEGAQVRGLGLNGAVLETPTKPEPLIWPVLPPAILEAANYVQGQMRQTLALNDTVMGQPEKGMPGNAQALQRAQAVQFHAISQAEAVRLVARNANGRLKMLKRFATSKRVAEIAGAARAYEVKEWSSEDLTGVQRFDVEPVNPVSQSYEARQSIGELLVSRGLMTPPDFLSFLQTGSLEQGLDAARLRKELVESNVALLQRGIGPPPVDVAASMAAGQPVFLPAEGEALTPMKSDPHHIAIPAYMGVLASPTSRQDAKVVRACTEAIQVSLEMWAALTPDEAAAYGIPPLPSSLMMAPPPPPGEGPVSEESAAPPTDDGQPQMPKPPRNPITGDQVGAEATGLPQ